MGTPTTTIMKSNAYVEPLYSKYPVLFNMWKMAVFVCYWYVFRALFWYVKHTLLLSDWHIIVTTTIIIQFVVYWGLNIPFTWIDLTHTPASLYRYKIQKKLMVGVAGHLKAAKVVILNQLLIALPLQCFIYPTIVWFGMNASEDIPSGLIVFRDVVITLLIEECLFYYVHRLLHWKRIYRYIHKQHHDFKAPIGIAAEYAHPIEFVFGNLLPVMAGPILLGSHVMTLWIWLGVALSSTVCGHSGYEFPWSPYSPTTVHDYHHESFRSNYGSIGLLDWIHGTDVDYFAHMRKLKEKALSLASNNSNGSSSSSDDNDNDVIADPYDEDESTSVPVKHD